MDEAPTGPEAIPDRTPTDGSALSLQSAGITRAPVGTILLRLLSTPHPEEPANLGSLLDLFSAKTHERICRILKWKPENKTQDTSLIARDVMPGEIQGVCLFTRDEMSAKLWSAYVQAETHNGFHTATIQQAQEAETRLCDAILIDYLCHRVGFKGKAELSYHKNSFNFGALKLINIINMAEIFLNTGENYYSLRKTYGFPDNGPPLGKELLRLCLLDVANDKSKIFSPADIELAGRLINKLNEQGPKQIMH